MKRTIESIRNVGASILSTIISIVVGFVAQKIFINQLGIEYSGLNGLFSNIITMLSISELGIGTTIVYHLYKPIVEDDKNKIKSLMKFYKTSYRIIAMVIIISGLAITPLIPTLVGDTIVRDNLIIIYYLFLVDTVFSYLLSYKRSILYANQKNYYINLIHTVYLIVLNFLQILSLYITHNYYIYLIIKIVMRVIENVIITIIANRMYPYLNDKDIIKIDKETRNDIFKKIKALLFHQVGAFVVLGTDNILISMFFGVGTVGLYSNYNMIINAVNTLLSQIFKSVTASVGNLIVTSDEKKTYNIYSKIRFFNYWISVVTSVCILGIMSSFIKIWLGNEYLLSDFVLITLVISYYFMVMKKSISTFKEAACIVYEDRWIPIIESVTNIGFSIIFLKIFGLAGVFIGTIISSFILHFYSYPKYVYKRLFKKNIKNYFINCLKEILLFVFISIVTFINVKIAKVDNNIVNFIICLIVSFITPNIILFGIYHRDDNYLYYKEIIRKVIKK